MHALLLLALCLLFALPLAGLAAYTSSKSQSSQGTTIQVNATNTSPPTWVPIGEPLDVVFGDKNVFDDSTNLQSTAKEYLALLRDPGKVQINLNRVSTDPGQAALNTSFRANPPTRLQYLVTLPINTVAGQTTTGDTYQFLAYVEEFTPEVRTDKKISSRFTLQVTGDITFVEGS